MNGSTSPRTYRSPRRAEQAARTRVAVVDAARGVLLDRGYAGTTMRTVAEHAGVSVQTVELAFGTKAALLAVVIDTTIAGDSAPVPVPVLERPDALAAARTETGEAFAAAVAALVGQVAARTADVLAVLAEATVSTPELRVLAATIDRRRLATARWIVAGLDRRAGRTRAGRQHRVDAVWLLMDPVVYRRLTRDRGWSPVAFQRWFVGQLLGL